MSETCSNSEQHAIYHEIALLARTIRTKLELILDTRPSTKYISSVLFGNVIPTAMCS